MLPLLDSSGSFNRLTRPFRREVLFKRTISGVFTKHRLPCCVSTHIYTGFIKYSVPNVQGKTSRKHFPLHAANSSPFPTANSDLHLKGEYKRFVLVIRLNVSRERPNPVGFQQKRFSSWGVTLTTACCLLVNISGLSCGSD